MIGLPLRHWEFHPGCIGYSRCSLETWRNPQEIDVKNCAWCATSNSEAKSWRRSALLSRPTASNTWHMMHMLLKIQNAEWQRHPPQEHLNSFPEVEWSWTLQQSSMNSMKEKKTKRNNNQTSLMTPTCGFQNWRNKWPPSFTLPSLLFLSTRLPLPAKWPPCDQALIFPVALPEVSYLILACRQRQFSQVAFSFGNLILKIRPWNKAKRLLELHGWLQRESVHPHFESEDLQKSCKNHFHWISWTYPHSPYLNSLYAQLMKLRIWEYLPDLQ